MLINIAKQWNTIREGNVESMREIKYSLQYCTPLIVYIVNLIK